jgi:hypothetical protein
MATVRKRGIKWHVQVRRSGHISRTRSFTHKADAEAWARKIERGIDSGEIRTDTAALRSTTVSDLLSRYRQDILPLKRGAAAEQYILNRFERSGIGSCTLANISGEHISSYRDQRLLNVKLGMLAGLT